MEKFKSIQGHERFRTVRCKGGYGVGGTYAKPEFAVTLPFIFNDSFYSVMEVRVIKGLPVDMILGMDAMEGRVVLDLVNYNISLEGKQIKMEEYYEIDDTCLLSKTGVHVSGDVHKNDFYQIDEGRDDLVDMAIILDLKEELAKIRKVRTFNRKKKELEVINASCDELEKIVLKHPRMFHPDFEAGCLNIPPVEFQFNKDINKVKPIVARLKPLSFKERKILEDWWKMAEKQGIIEESHSTWRNCIFPVKKALQYDEKGKPVQKWRIVTPFFGLNKLLNCRANLMPRVVEIMVAIAKKKWFTKLDLAQAFFQIPVSKKSRPYLAITASGFPLAQYRALPMGLTISSSILQGELQKILHKFYWKWVICYADDILIYSDGTKEEHIKIVNEILEVLAKANVKLKPSKVDLAQKTVEFLGMTICQEGWKLHGKFTESVEKAKKPESIKGVRSFIGLCSWQRRFIHNFAEKVRPLTNLLRKTNGIFSWDEECEQSYQTLKKEMASAPVLRHPDFEKPFRIYSDASKHTLGGVLCQVKNNKEVVIGYFSRRLSDTEESRSIAERELMAMVESVEHFRPFIYGLKCTCFVDQKSLKWIVKQDHNNKFMKYRLRLEEYNYEIRYVRGEANRSDWSSRYAHAVVPEDTADERVREDSMITDPDTPMSEESDPNVFRVNKEDRATVIADLSKEEVCLIQTRKQKQLDIEKRLRERSEEVQIKPTTSMEKKFRSVELSQEAGEKAGVQTRSTSQRPEVWHRYVKEGFSTRALSSDRFYKAVKKAKAAGAEVFKFEGLTFTLSDFKWKNKYLEYRNKLVVPKAHVNGLLRQLHYFQSSTFHAGVVKTIQHVKKRYFWPQYNKDVNTFLSGCSVCLKSKRVRGIMNMNLPLDSGKEASSPFKHLGLDFYGGLALPDSKGKKVILTVIDYNTRFVRFLPVSSRKGELLWTTMQQHWFSIFGYPELITTDNAQEFLEGVFKAELDDRGIDLRNSGVKSHNQQGITERVHRTLTEHLNILKVLTGGLSSWSEEVYLIAARINSTYHSSLQETPQFLVFGYDDVTVYDKKVADNKERYKAWEELRLQRMKETIKGFKFNKLHLMNPGELVFIQWPREDQSKKFELNEGPCRILQVDGFKQALVRNIMTGREYNVSVDLLRMAYVEETDENETDL